MVVELALFIQLSQACAPQVAVETLAAVAQTESDFEALAIHDNASGRSYRPVTSTKAVALATELVDRGHSLDLGLMQVNTNNLRRLSLSLVEAFDPCRSLAAAQRVLTGFYAAPEMGGDEQAALRRALSRYNTGDATRGIVNGYVQRVQASAEVVVPAIRLHGDTGPGGTAGPAWRQDASIAATHPPAFPAASPVPSWDVYTLARTAREQTSNLQNRSPRRLQFVAPSRQALAEIPPFRVRPFPLPAVARSTR